MLYIREFYRTHNSTIKTTLFVGGCAVLTAWLLKKQWDIVDSWAEEDPEYWNN